MLFSADQKENFPVASLLLPRKLRHAISVIYRFARSADNLADEGNETPQARLTALSLYKQQLNIIAQKQPPSLPLFIALDKVIQQHQLPLQPFYDLLDAFCQDVHTHRYKNILDVLHYCTRSANPIGRLMLSLYGITDPHLQRYADTICTGLQLANFCQDVALDWQIKRIYIPQAEIQKAGLDPTLLPTYDASPAWQHLMQGQVARARHFLNAGRPLVKALQNYPLMSTTHTPNRLAWELRLIIEGGLRILERIEQINYRVFKQRPTLNPKDWLIIFSRGLYFHRHTQHTPYP